MQVINSTYISNAQGIYFPEFYSTFPDRVNEDMIKCNCQDFEQAFVFSDVLYLQVHTEGIPRIEIGPDTYNPTASDNNNYNFVIPLSSYAGQTISLNLISPPVSGFAINTFSNPFYVKSFDDGCTILLEWRSECESMGIDYTLDPNFLSSIRIPLRFIRPSGNDISSMNITKDSFGRWNFCSSDLDEQWTMATMEMPDWMHQVVRKAMNNSYFAINGAEFFSRTGFRFTERRCCYYQGESTLIPKDSNWAVNNCCVNQFSGFVQPPQSQIACNTPSTPPNVAIDTRGSSDSDNNIITSSSTGVSYIYNFGGVYYVEIPANLDPSIPASWTYIGGSGTLTEFLANIVANITLPVGGFAGYFEFDCVALQNLGIENMSIGVTVNDDGVASRNATCVVSCDMAEVECPIPSLANSTQPDLNNITITNVGTTNNLGAAIHNDPDYNYIHTFYAGPCGTLSTPYFTVSGVGGTSSLTFSNWNLGINATAQTNVMALFSGGMDAAGYTFDKEAVVIALQEQGFSAGGDWCVISDVIHVDGCSDSTQLDIAGGLILFQHAYQVQGITPTTQNSSLTGLATYHNENGQYSYINVNTQIAADIYFMEGDIGLLQADGSATTLDSTSGLYGDFFDYINDDRVYHSMALDGNNTIDTFANAYYEWDNGNSSSVRLRFQVQPPIVEFAGNVIVRNLFEATGAGPLGSETIGSFSFTVLKYPLNGGGINITGSDDPSAGTAGAQVVSLLAGGTPQAFTNPAGLTVSVTAPTQGTYYVLVDVVTTSGLPLQLVSGFTMINI